MKTIPILACCAAAAVLAACTAFPDLGDPARGYGLAPRPQDGFPRLVPVEPLLADAEVVQIGETTGDEITARAARLRARAARLRHIVVDRGTRARMRDGVAPIGG